MSTITRKRGFPNMPDNLAHGLLIRPLTPAPIELASVAQSRLSEAGNAPAPRYVSNGRFPRMRAISRTRPPHAGQACRWTSRSPWPISSRAGACSRASCAASACNRALRPGAEGAPHRPNPAGSSGVAHGRPDDDAVHRADGQDGGPGDRPALSRAGPGSGRVPRAHPSGGRRRALQCMTRPPSTLSACPVM